MELSEAKDILKDMKESMEQSKKDITIDSILKALEDSVKAIDTVLKALDNSITKDEIRKKLEEQERLFDFYAGREHQDWVDGEFDYEVCDDISIKIGILKELLGEE